MGEVHVKASANSSSPAAVLASVPAKMPASQAASPCAIAGRTDDRNQRIGVIWCRRGASSFICQKLRLLCLKIRPASEASLHLCAQASDSQETQRGKFDARTHTD